MISLYERCIKMFFCSALAENAFYENILSTLCRLCSYLPKPAAREIARVFPTPTSFTYYMNLYRSVYDIFAETRAITADILHIVFGPHLGETHLIFRYANLKAHMIQGCWCSHYIGHIAC